MNRKFTAVIRISDWYTVLGEYSFPTVFLRLNNEETTDLIAGNETSAASRSAMARLQKSINAVFGTAFVSADACAPDDSPLFHQGRWVSFGKTAWRLLSSSEKTRTAFHHGHTDCLTVRPFRRMDPTREFRMFVKDRSLVAVSQLCLDRHYPQLLKRSQEIWQKSRKLTETTRLGLPADDLAIDIYLTSDGSLLIVDINDWGTPTDPLLLRTWDRDWNSEVGMKLIPPPVRMKGDISVSF